jgi:hypothetical protein
MQIAPQALGAPYFILGGCNLLCIRNHFVSCGACLRHGSHAVQVTLTHKDAVSNKVETSTCSIILPDPTDFSNAVVTTSVPALEAAATSISPSGEKKFVVRSAGPTTPLTIEVWKGYCKDVIIEVPEALHGSLLADKFFSTGPVWNADEDKVAYVAEV